MCDRYQKLHILLILQMMTHHLWLDNITDVMTALEEIGKSLVNCNHFHNILDLKKLGIFEKVSKLNRAIA